MSATDDLLEHAERYASTFDAGGLPAPPARQTVVLTCMDARIDPAALLGLSPGDAHVLRNAGGVVSDDALRSLAASQRFLGTTEVLVIQHSGCGMTAFDDEAFRRSLGEETGTEPPWAVDAPAGTAEDVQRTVAAIESSPFLVSRDRVRGFLYDIDTGQLREVR